MSIACVGEQEWVEIEGGRRRRNKILVYPRDGRHGSKDAEIKYDQILEKTGGTHSCRFGFVRFMMPDTYSVAFHSLNADTVYMVLGTR